MTNLREGFTDGDMDSQLFQQLALEARANGFSGPLLPTGELPQAAQ